MAGITSLIANTFGLVQFSGNTNVKASGENNTGSVQSSSNLLIDAIKCQLNLIGNANININAGESVVGCQSSSNVKLEGKGNTVNIDGSSNVELNGTGNQVIAASSSNLQLFVNSTNLNLGGNRNTKVQMNGGKVVANDNVNLKISGEDGQSGSLNVKGTKNHNFKGLPKESIAAGVKQNEVELSVGNSQSRQVGPAAWLSNIFGGWSNRGNDVTYSLTYIDNVQVDGQNYKLDDFNFSIEPKAEAKYDVSLNGGSVDPGSLSVQMVAPNQCLVTATKLGEKLALKFTAPSIIPGAGDRFTMDMSGGGSSSSNL